MKALLTFIDSAYCWFLRVANFCQHPFLLAIRLYWGWQFFDTGRGKLSDIPKVVAYFTSLGVPAPALNAHFIAWLETVGGIMLMAGLAARLIALPLVIDMIVAFAVSEKEALRTIFSDDPSKFYAAAPYTFLFASLIILFFGPGWFSLDTLIRSYRNKRKPDATAQAR